MKIIFEEYAAPQRAGGIEVATQSLVTSLAGQGMTVARRRPESPDAIDEPPDCVHIHGIWSPVLARRFLQWRRLGIPCLVTVHGMLEPWALAHKRLKKRVAWHLYQKRLLNQAAALHATSEREAENFMKLGLKAPIAMIPWGGEVEEKSGGRGQGAEDRERVGEGPALPESSSGQRTALFVGRVFPVKGLPILVEAWARIRPVGWKMKIVGPDEAGHRAEVEVLVREAELEAEFEFAGALEGADLKDAYQKADLFVLPSYTENFGMVVVEALAHGLPVVTTQGTPWQLLEIERCGWWVPVSVKGIAAALADATRRSPAELASMGARGMRVVSERFSWDTIALDFINCYEWMLGKGGIPGCMDKHDQRERDISEGAPED